MGRWWILSPGSIWCNTGLRYKSHDPQTAVSGDKVTRMDLVQYCLQWVRSPRVAAARQHKQLFVAFQAKLWKTSARAEWMMRLGLTKRMGFGIFAVLVLFCGSYSEAQQ